MKRLVSLTATALTAASVAIAPAPAVAADGDDLGKIIAGLAIAGIVAKVIDDRRDRKREEREVTTQAGQFGTVVTPEHIQRDSRRAIEGTVRPYRRDEHGRWPKLRAGYKRQALPEQCLRTVGTARGDRLAYGARCLDRRYRHADKLPASCQTVVRTPRGYRAVYGARCLRRDGWQVAGR